MNIQTSNTCIRTLAHLTIVIYTLSIFLPLARPVVAQVPIENSLESSTYKSRMTFPVNNVNALVIEKKDGEVMKRILVSDYLSSTKSIITQDGTVTLTPSYFPYGSSVAPVLLAQTSKQYTGQTKVTNDSSVYNYKARYYSPTTGIFIQPDSVEGPTRYTYVAGNPVMANDPSGNVMTTGIESGSSGSTLGGNNKRVRENLRIADVQNQHFDSPLHATGVFDEDVIDKALMTDDQFFTLQVLGVGLLTGGAAASIDLGFAPIAMLKSAAARKIGKDLAANFTVGSLTSGGMELVAQKAMYDHVSTSQVVHSAIYGGLSQAISFGLLSPEKIAGSRFMTAFSGFVPQIPTKIASWAPALLVDSAIWTPQSIDPEKKDYVDSYKFQLTTQTGLQTAISGLDAAGERFLSRAHLGSKFFFFGTGLLMANMWANKGTSYPGGGSVNAINKP